MKSTKDYLDKTECLKSELTKAAVGFHTPTIVKYNFWRMTHEWMDAIKPDVTMFLHYETIEKDGKEIVAVDIQRGPDRPYYLAKKGMCPEGVYVRQGYSSVPATDTAIRRMIKETDQTVFKDRREFTGSLMQQMNEVYDFIDFRSQTRATIEKLLRIDVRDYPEIAVREALLNLLVHRDYSFSASALISIYADRIEFVSIGGLMPGIDLEDIMVGISVCRNPDLANVFYRLHLIEAYGTGMGKIMTAYEGMEEKPAIETTKNAFKIILPNINAKYETEKASVPRVESITSFAAGAEKSLSDEEEKILEHARSHGAITRNDVIELLEVSTSTASRVIRKNAQKMPLNFVIGYAFNLCYL